MSVDLRILLTKLPTTGVRSKRAKRGLLTGWSGDLWGISLGGIGVVRGERFIISSTLGESSE